MKQLTCEMCGGTELIKQDGVFVCQNCGMKYSVEEAKKMMIEGTVDVQGTVQVDNTAFVERYLANARRAKQKEDWAETEKYYNMVEQNDPTNIEAVFYSTFARVKEALLEAETRDKRQSVFKVLSNTVSVIEDNYDNTSEEHRKLIFEVFDDINGLKKETIVPTTHLASYVTKNGYGSIVDRNQTVENDPLQVTYDMIDEVMKLFVAFFFNVFSNSPVGYLGKALSYLACHEYERASNEVTTASKYVAPENDKEYIKLIINMSASELKRTLLINAAAFCNYDAVKYLVDLGSEIDYKDKRNCTALWYACSARNTDETNRINDRKIAKLLLDKGASVDITSKNGVSLYNKKTDPEIESMILAKHPYLEKGKSGCYVATAVYGSYDCPQVWTLRRYRDYTLAETWHGRAFIKTYYAISPTLVKWFGHTEWFKKMWQGKLDRMVAKLQENGVESTPYEDKEW